MDMFIFIHGMVLARGVRGWLLDTEWVVLDTLFYQQFAYNRVESQQFGNPAFLFNLGGNFGLPQEDVLVTQNVP